MPSMAYVYYGEILVIYHPLENPTDGEWSEMLASLAGKDLNKYRTLAWTDGGGPSLRQRKQLSEAIGGARHKVAGIVTNRLARIIGTAVSMANPFVKIYHPNEFEAALAYLDIPADSRGLVRRYIENMKKQFTGGDLAGATAGT
jgi:hypothetical protein